MASNAQKLARVLSLWARPAISQLTADKISNMGFAKTLEQTLKGIGLVSQNYKIADELKPFVNNAVDVMAVPILEGYLSKVPDAALPRLARSIVETALLQPTFSILEGMVEFSKQDMIELEDLLDKNLPVEECKDEYKVIK